MMIMTMEDYDEVIFKLFELFITSSSLLENEAMKGRREYVDEVRIYEEKILSEPHKIMKFFALHNLQMCPVSQ